MKTESTVHFVLRLALTLLAITSVVAACLAGVNAITAPKIAELNERKTQEAIEAVLPGGGTQAGVWTDSTGLVSNVYESETGYAVEVKPSGFDNTITMMVGVDREGALLGISVISHTETAGLGATCAADNAAGQAFRGQFVGMTGEGGAIAVTKDGGSVDAITGATITSRAVCVGINAALECVAHMSNIG